MHAPIAFRQRRGWWQRRLECGRIRWALSRRGPGLGLRGSFGGDGRGRMLTVFLDRLEGRERARHRAAKVRT